MTKNWNGVYLPRKMLNQYLGNSNRLGRLSEEDKKRTFEKKEVNVASRNSLIENNIWLCVYLARPYLGRDVSLNEDFIQNAILGLMEAVERFDPERGNKLSTYACWWVNAYLIEMKRSARFVGLGEYILNPYKANRILNAFNELREKLGRDPDASELAEYMSVSISEVTKLLVYFKKRSEFLSVKVENSEKVTLLNDDRRGFENAGTLGSEDIAILKEEVDKLFKYLKWLQANPPTNRIADKDVFSRKIEMFKDYCGISDMSFQIGKYTKEAIGRKYGFSREYARISVKEIFQMLLRDAEKHDFLNIVKMIFDTEEFEKKERKKKRKNLKKNQAAPVDVGTFLGR